MTYNDLFITCSLPSIFISESVLRAFLFDLLLSEKSFFVFLGCVEGYLMVEILAEESVRSKIDKLTVLSTIDLLTDYLP